MSSIRIWSCPVCHRIESVPDPSYFMPNRICQCSSPYTMMNEWRPIEPDEESELEEARRLRAVVDAAKVLQAWHHNWQAPCTFEEALAGLDAALAALGEGS